MARLYNWYIGQLVTAQAMRNGDTALEQGDYDLAADMGFVGLISGGAVAENAGTPNMTVDVSGLLARSPIGERIRIVAPQDVDLTFDHLTQPTAVTTPGNSRYVDIYAVFDRIPSDPRIDATNMTVYFQQDEGFGFDVVQGAEALSPAAPAALGDGVLLARVLLTFGQTQILDADIDTDVAAFTVKISGSPLEIIAGTFTEALEQLANRYNDHVTGAADQHAGGDLTYAGSGPFANGAFIAAGNLETSLDDLVSKLGSIGAGVSGAHHLGSAQLTAASGGINIPAGTLASVLAALKSSGFTDVGAMATWLGGRTNPATDLQSALSRIVNDLAAQTTNDDGMERVGGQAVAGSVDSLTTGSSRSQANELLVLVNARARLASAETITGAWTFQSTLARSGASGVHAYRVPHQALSNADATIDTSYDTYDGASLTASRFYTLKSTSPAPVAGARIWFVQKNAYGGGFYSRFRREDLTIIADVPATSWALFEFDGTAWFTIAWGPNVISVV